jgi:hypothetical protein
MGLKEDQSLLTSAATIFKLSVNAKQLEHPALQADPGRSESGHGHHFNKEQTPPCDETISRLVLSTRID